MLKVGEIGIKLKDSLPRLLVKRLWLDIEPLLGNCLEEVLELRVLLAVMSRLIIGVRVAISPMVPRLPRILHIVALTLAA